MKPPPTLKQFRQRVLKKVAAHIKSYTLITPEEIKKVFPPDQFYAVTLYWFLSSQPPTPPEEVIDFLAIAEISIKAGFIHNGIEDGGGGAEESTIAIKAIKNTRKILLGDMLISTSINAINLLENEAVKKGFYRLSKQIFLQRLGNSLPHSSPASSGTNWISILPLLPGSPSTWKKVIQEITALIQASQVASPSIQEKISNMEADLVSRKVLTPEAGQGFAQWLREELTPLENKEIQDDPKQIPHPKKISLHRLI